MTARRTADLTIRARDGRIRATVHWPTIARAIVFGLGLVGLLSPAAQAAGDTQGTSGMPPTLVQAQKIRTQINARYLAPGGPKLAVTEASSTAVVESFTLLAPDLLESRIIPAANGVYYAICAVPATCPYPARRVARPAAEPLPRRLALELALHTFLETSADVVAVSLPTRRFILFIVEREELAGELDLPTLAETLSDDPSRRLSASQAALVDQLTRPRVFLIMGLEPTPTGRDSLSGIPRWPTATR